MALEGKCRLEHRILRKTTASLLEAASALILAAAAVGPGDAVLDVACGTGNALSEPPPNASAAKVEERRGEVAIRTRYARPV